MNLQNILLPPRWGRVSPCYNNNGYVKTQFPERLVSWFGSDLSASFSVEILKDILSICQPALLSWGVPLPKYWKMLLKIEILRVCKSYQKRSFRSCYIPQINVKFNRVFNFEIFFFFEKWIVQLLTNLWPILFICIQPANVFIYFITIH